MTSERTHHRLLYAEAVESNRGGQACVWCGHARHTQRSYAQPDVAPAAAPTTNWRDTQHNTFCNLFPRYTKKARNAPKRLVACHSRKLRERHEQQRNKEKKRLTKQQIPSSCATAIPTQSIPPADSPGPNPAVLPPPSPALTLPTMRGGGSPTHSVPSVASPRRRARPPPQRPHRVGRRCAPRRPRHGRRRAAPRPPRWGRRTRRQPPARNARRPWLPPAVRGGHTQAALRRAAARARAHPPARLNVLLRWLFLDLKAATA
mgnify:CR=1 FL=1